MHRSGGGRRNGGDVRRTAVVIGGVMITLAIPLLTGAGSRSAAAPECFGRRATIVGTPGHDTLVGTNRSDVIVSGDGADQIYSRGGDDYVCAGPGRRTERDPDTGGRIVFGDVVDAGEGDDRVHGGRHYDRLIGDGFRLEELGPPIEPGSDLLVSGSGRSDLLGNGGDDVLRGGRRHDEVDGGGGDDLLRGAGSGDTLAGAGGNDRIEGGPARDEIIPMQGDDDVAGGRGRDLLNLFVNSCGQGCQSSHRLDLFVHLGKGIARGMGSDRLRGIEDVWGGSGDDRIVGNARANFLGGQDPQGLGEDHDSLFGRDGRDRLMLGEGDGQVVRGGSGRDLLLFTGSVFGVDIDLAHRTLGGGVGGRIRGVEDAHGSGGDDRFAGSWAANLFFGGSGADTALGRRGDDQLDGGRGDNSNDGGRGRDRCVRPSPSTGAVNCEV